MVKIPVAQHAAWSLDPQYPHKKAEHSSAICNSNTEDGDKQSPRVPGPASLVSQCTPGPVGHSISRKQGEE